MRSAVAFNTNVKRVFTTHLRSSHGRQTEGFIRSAENKEDIQKEWIREYSCRFGTSSIPNWNYEELDVGADGGLWQDGSVSGTRPYDVTSFSP